MNAAECILRERQLSHKRGCAILRGDVVCDCGMTREREVRAEVSASRGLVGLDNDRQTFFIVKKLERDGFLDYCGRDTGRIIVQKRPV